MEIITPSVKKNYPEAYQKIAEKLRVSGLNEIGDPGYREKQRDRFKDKDGEFRPASMDLEKMSRVCRTLQVFQLSAEELSKLHAREKRVGYFIINIKKMFRQDYKSYSLSNDRIDAVNDFNDEHRPEPIKFMGISIPPYFPPDNEFDGMEYHHAWDMGLLHNQSSFRMPEHQSRSGKRVLDEV